MESGFRIPFKNVDEYISRQPEQIRMTLELLRKTIKMSAPEAQEVISYQMPGYKFHGVLVWFAAFKSHYGFYCIPDVLSKFADQLSAFELSKSAIRIPLDTPVPEKLIAEIVQYAVKENLRKKLMKESFKYKTSK
jgi:uncharacterized protein YdhG (YjbR/CyaY superfamily)